MAESGSYNPEDDGSEEPLVPVLAAQGQAQAIPVQPQGEPKLPKTARKNEWRTPPLWGFRDSGPYLHDGRAQTLDQAVAMHGGQSAATAQKYFQLAPTERLQLEAFLKSLVAPSRAPEVREVACVGD